MKILGMFTALLGIAAAWFLVSFPPESAHGSVSKSDLRKLEYSIKKLERNHKRHVQDLEKKIDKLEDKLEDRKKEFKKYRREMEKKQDKWDDEWKKFKKDYEEHTHYLLIRKGGGSWDNDRYRPFEIMKTELKVGKKRR